jgi:cell division transport system permease protein
MLDRGVKAYEGKLTDDYSIVVVSDESINKNDIKAFIPQISTISEINKDRYIDKLRDKMSKADLVYLKATLPKFYSVKLKKLPSDTELNELAQKMRSYKKVKKVETFKKTINKFHQFLNLAKSASYIFTLFISVISFLLILKQMEIWTLQHQNRMYVMGLFGAPYWMKSASLYRSVIIDSIVAALLVGLFFHLLPNFANLNELKENLSIDLQNFNFIKDTAKLTLISLIISIVSVTIIILRQKDS